MIICFYERYIYLKRCLDSLGNCFQDFDEVIIADDGSSKEVVKKLENLISTYEFDIKHVWHPKRGFRVAAARNNGIRHATGDYLVFLDCDLLVFQDTIKRHLSAASKGRFVAGNCKYLTKEQSEIILQSGVDESVMVEFYRNLPDKDLNKDHRKFVKRTVLFRLRLANPKKQSLGGHFSIFRKDIESINGYDESFEGWGGEDEDLGIRLVSAGIFGRSVTRSARALHLWHPREIGDKHWKEGPNIEYFNRKRMHYYCVDGLQKAFEHTG